MLSLSMNPVMHTEEMQSVNFYKIQVGAKAFYGALLELLTHVETFQNEVCKVKPLHSCSEDGQQSQLKRLMGQLETLLSQVTQMKSDVEVIRKGIDKMQNNGDAEIDTLPSAPALLKFECSASDDHEDSFGPHHDFSAAQTEATQQTGLVTDRQRRQAETKTSNSKKCYICGKSISRRMDHMQKYHPGEKSFPCKMCEMAFDNYKEFQNHIKCHARTLTFKCDLCNMTLKSRRGLSEHMISHNGKVHVCDVCGKSFRCKISVIKCKHGLITKDNDGKPQSQFVFTCKTCGIHFATPELLNKHVDTKCEAVSKVWATVEVKDHKQSAVNTRLYSCSFCPKSYTRLRALKQHINFHTGIQSFECELCHEKFYTSKAKGMHKYEKHNCEFPGFKCKICGEMCRSGLGRETHYLTHTQEERNRNNIVIKMTECDVCGKIVRRNHLTIHKLTHSVKNSFICEICGKGFRQATYLKRHVLFHMKPEDRPVPKPRFSQPRTVGSQPHQRRSRPHQKGEKNFVCSICGKDFISKFNLILHNRIHTGEKPYRCDVCGKSFRSPQAYKAHGVVHTNVKAFKCDVCGVAFNVQANLKRHYSIHTGQKPFQCDFCGKSFIQKANLEVHRRIHTGEKPFQCDHCGKKFSDPSTLYKHKGRHEKDTAYRLESL